jgi:hypothetical protein
VTVGLKRALAAAISVVVPDFPNAPEALSAGTARGSPSTQIAAGGIELLVHDDERLRPGDALGLSGTSRSSGRCAAASKHELHSAVAVAAVVDGVAVVCSALLGGGLMARATEAGREGRDAAGAVIRAGLSAVKLPRQQPEEARSAAASGCGAEPCVHRPACACW